MKRKSMWASLVAVLFFGLLYAAYLYGMRFYPLELAEWSARWELSQAGVKSVTVEGLHAWEADRCGGAQVSKGARGAAGCSCVALIHGLGDTAMTWKKLLVASREEWKIPVRLLALDLPGSGETPAPASTEDYQARRLAARVKESLSSVCSKWTVVGNSFGGWVATWVGLDWPEGVIRLVLAGSAGIKEEPGQTDLKSLETFHTPSVEALKDFQKRAYHRPRELPAHVWAAAVRRMEKSNSREVMAAQVEADRLDERLSGLKMPVLLLWGESDRISPPSRAERFRELRGRGPTLESRVAECGHLPQKECPAEVFSAIRRIIHFGLL